MKNFFEALQKLLAPQPRKEIVKESFKHPLAEQVNWTPLERGGASFTTHETRLLNESQLAIVSTSGMKLFSLFFLAAGIACLTFPLAKFFFFSTEDQSSSFIDQPQGLLLAFVGLIFTFAGCAMLKHALCPAVFDSILRQFHRGHPKSPKESCAFSDIVALQILEELVKSSGKNKRRYFSYELNLVLRDGKRINIMDHGDLEKIKLEAVVIQKFVNPKLHIWDATLPEHTRSVA